MNLAGKLGGLQEIASAAGIGNQIVSPSQLYPDILASERVLQNVIYHKYRTESFPSEVTLIQFYGYDDEDSVYNYEKCLKKLRGSLITIEVDRKTTIVTLKVTTTEKQLSADIANQITAELDYYQRNFRRTNASEQRKFLEQRLSEVNQDLTKSEEKLKDFREKNRKVEQSPQLLLEQDRFARDVELNSALFIELKKQYELAKLDEIKNTPIVQVLDVARAPAKKSGPPRRIYVFAAAFLSFVGCTSWYGLSHRLNQLRDEDHAFAQVYDTVAQSLIQTISKVGKVLPKSKTEKSASS
jgi:capsule polysaccharide export protein KpsE/RkpR